MTLGNQPKIIRIKPNICYHQYKTRLVNATLKSEQLLFKIWRKNK